MKTQKQTPTQSPNKSDNRLVEPNKTEQTGSDNIQTPTQIKFNVCPNCGEKSKIKLKNNRDDAPNNERRYYCKLCCQIFTNEGEHK